MHLVAFAGLSGVQLAILLVLGILIFGKRLPEMGKYLAKGIREFQDGIKGIENDVTSPIARETDGPALENRQPRPPQRVTEPTPKFVENDSPSTTPPIA